MTQEKPGVTGGQEEPLYQKEFLERLQKRSSVELMARLGQGTFDREKPFNPQTPVAEKDAKEVIKTPAQAITEKVTEYRKTAWEAWDKYQEENNTEWVIKEEETKKWKDMSPEEKQGVRLQAYADRQTGEVWDKFSGKDDGTQDSFRKGLESLGLDWSKVGEGGQREVFRNFVKGDLYQKYFSADKNTAYEILQSLIEKSTRLSSFTIDDELVKDIQSLQPFLTALFGEKQAFDALSAVADLHLTINKHHDFFKVLKDYDGKTMALGKGKREKDEEEGILDYLKGASCQKEPVPLPEPAPKPAFVPPPPEKKDKAEAGGKVEGKEDIGEIDYLDPKILEWVAPNGFRVKLVKLEDGGDLKVFLRDSKKAGVQLSSSDNKDYEAFPIAELFDWLDKIDQKKEFQGASNKIALAFFNYCDREEAIESERDLFYKRSSHLTITHEGKDIVVVGYGNNPGYYYRSRSLEDSEITEGMRRSYKIAVGKELLRAWAAMPPEKKPAVDTLEGTIVGEKAKEDIGEMTKFDSEGLEWTRPDGEKVRIRQCRQSKGDAREGIEASFGSSRILKNRFWNPDRILNGIDDSDKIALFILDKVLKDKENPMCKDLAKKATGKLQVSYKGRLLMVKLISLDSFEATEEVQGARHEFSTEKVDIDNDEMMRAIKVAVGRKIFSIWAAPRGSRTGISQEVLRSAITFQFRDNSSRGLREALTEGGFLPNDLSPEEKEQAFRDTLPEERMEKLSDPESQLKETLGPHEEAPIVGISIRPDEFFRFIKEKIKLPNDLRISKDASTFSSVDLFPKDFPLSLGVKGKLVKSIMGIGEREVAKFVLTFATKDGKLTQTVSNRFISFGRWTGQKDQKKILEMLGKDSTGLDTKIKERMDSLLKQNGIDRFVSRIDIGDDGMLVFDFSKTEFRRTLDLETPVGV